MDSLKSILLVLKDLGCVGIKISFEDEGALHNEVISMCNLTTSVGLELTVKIGGCEAKRDIVDCVNLNCDAIVAPMVESKFALNKFLQSLKVCGYNKKKGFNLETIESYKNLNELSTLFDNLDFVTLGRGDFICSMEKDRSFVDIDEMYEIAENIFKKTKMTKAKCYIGGFVTSNSKNFIQKLVEKNLLDKFETRYVIYDVNKCKIDNFENLLYWASKFEVEWLNYVRSRYLDYANKDLKRIVATEERLSVLQEKK
jgi:4-hydroxy-2-oxoheptanedioate aldolase